MMRFLFLIIPVLMSLAPAAYAQDYGLPGDYLLELYPSAHALAMGGGSVAFSGSTDALFLNPAGLNDLNHAEFSALYQRSFDAMHFYTSAFGYPFGKMGVLALGVIGTTSPEAPSIDVWGVQRGNYRSSDNTVLLSYARKLGRYGSMGGSLKMATQQVDVYKGMGVGFDVGGQLTPLPWLSLGLSLFNLGGPSVRLNQMDDAYTSALRSGAGVTMLKGKLKVYADADVLELTGDPAQYQGSSSHPIRWRSGLNWSPFDYVSGSLGLNDRMFTTGLSFTVKSIRADYGLGYQRDPSVLGSGFAHAFSLCFAFGKPVPQMETELAAKSREVESRSNLQLGQQAFIMGRPSEARRLIGDYVKLHPEDQNATALLTEVEEKLSSGEVADLVVKAESEIGKRNFTEAETLLTQALLLLPSHEKANQLKQRLLLLRENDKRIETIKSLYTQQQYEEMAKELEVVLRLDSVNAEALEYRLKIADYLSQFEADKHYNLASKYYYEDKDAEKANNELQLALGLKSDHKEAQALYNKISDEIKSLYLKKVGQMVDAKGLAVDNKDLKKLIALDVQDKLLSVRKMIDAGQSGQALADLEAILRDAPGNKEALELKKKAFVRQENEKSQQLYNEGLKLLNDGKFAEAEAKAVEALERDGSNAKAKGLLDDIHLKQRKENLDNAEKLAVSGKRPDLENAKKMVEEYLAVDAGSERAKKMQKDIQTELYVQDANALIDKGEYDKADQVIQKALQANPDNKKVQEAFKNLKAAMEALQ
ncbi:MAG: hypothetical protein V1913_00150 [Fibrobacterota bacterium]